MDEAMHPLTLLAVGLYGQVLPDQNGAPLRLVIPWKYGFKSVKSIVRIQLHGQPSRRRPGTSAAPQRVWVLCQREPDGGPSALEPGDRTAHRRVHASGKTLMFNGYADQVGTLYTGMDLKKLY